MSNSGPRHVSNSLRRIQYTLAGAPPGPGVISPGRAAVLVNEVEVNAVCHGLLHSGALRRLRAQCCAPHLAVQPRFARGCNAALLGGARAGRTACCVSDNVGACCC